MPVNLDFPETTSRRADASLIAWILPSGCPARLSDPLDERFTGRYKAILVDAEEYLAAVVRHIHLNAVEAGLVKMPEEYRLNRWV